MVGQLGAIGEVASWIRDGLGGFVYVDGVRVYIAVGGCGSLVVAVAWPLCSGRERVC